MRPRWRLADDANEECSQCHQWPGTLCSERCRGNTTQTSNVSSKPYQSSISVESSDDEDLFNGRPKAPPKATPKPPSLDFFSVNDPRLLHMFDEEEQPRTIVSYVSEADLD